MTPKNRSGIETWGIFKNWKPWMTGNSQRCFFPCWQGGIWTCSIVLHIYLGVRHPLVFLPTGFFLMLALMLFPLIPALLSPTEASGFSCRWLAKRSECPTNIWLWGVRRQREDEAFEAGIFFSVLIHLVNFFLLGSMNESPWSFIAYNTFRWLITSQAFGDCGGDEMLQVWKQITIHLGYLSLDIPCLRLCLILHPCN